MHRFLARGLVALTAGWVGTAGPLAVAADPPAPVAAPPAESRSLIDRLNPFANEPEPEAGAVRQPGPRVRRSVGPLSSETMVAVLQAEKDAYTRRLDVCHRLRQIAFDTNDDRLEAKANELERMATDAYQARVSRLGVKTGGPLPPLPPASVGVLDRTLGSGIAVNPLTVDKRPNTADKSATAKVNQFKEVKP